MLHPNDRLIAGYVVVRAAERVVAAMAPRRVKQRRTLCGGITRMGATRSVLAKQMRLSKRPPAPGWFLARALGSYISAKQRRVDQRDLQGGLKIELLAT